MADNSGGFMGGLSEGLQQGTNMGYLYQQAQAMKQNQIRQDQQMQMEAQKAQAEEERARQKAMIDKATILNTMFTGTKDKDRKAEIWKASAPIFNELLGTQFRPDGYTPVTESVMEQLQNDWKQVEAGKMKYENFMGRVGTYTAIANEEEQKALTNARSYFTAADPSIYRLRNAKATSSPTDKDPQLWSKAAGAAKRIVEAQFFDAKMGVIDSPDRMQEYTDKIDQETERQYDIMKGSLRKPAATPTAEAAPTYIMNAAKANPSAKKLSFSNGETWTKDKTGNWTRS